jgi:hypothetical protein
MVRISAKGRSEWVLRVQHNELRGQAEGAIAC